MPGRKKAKYVERRQPALLVADRPKRQIIPKKIVSTICDHYKHLVMFVINHYRYIL